MPLPSAGAEHPTAGIAFPLGPAAVLLGIQPTERCSVRFGEKNRECDAQADIGIAIREA